ncbi:toll-like receptor 1 [Aphomia sociella]
MGGRVLLSIVLVFFSAGISCQDAKVTTTLEPINNIVLESGICRKCRCEDTKVDCTDQGLTNYFQKGEWEALKDLKPTHVDMSENTFVNITMMAELPIKVLNLSRCGVEFIEFSSFMGLVEMHTLDLSHNKLTYEKLSPHAFEGPYSPEEYEPLSSMRTLNLAYNDFHSLQQDAFEHLPELVELDLSGNPLTTIDQVTLVAISSLPMLKTLRLRSCQLKEIPDKFLHTPRYLERLDISDNQLTSVPQELEETKNLLYLNLNQNPIVELEVNSEDYPGFPNLRKLKELHMCNMPVLKQIGLGAMAGLENLESLHMSNNPQLTFLDPKALARPDDIGETYDWPLIKELYLQSNNLSVIDSRFIARWDLLTAIDVSNNPLLCDCTTQWMVDNLVPVIESKTFNASEKLVCQEPVEMRGYTMKHLHDIHRNMRCLDKYGNRPEKDGAILLGLLIGVLLAVPVMLALVLMWRNGYFGWAGLRGPRDVSRAFYKRAPDDDNII